MTSIPLAVTNTLFPNENETKRATNSVKLVTTVYNLQDSSFKQSRVLKPIILKCRGRDSNPRTLYGIG